MLLLLSIAVLGCLQALLVSSGMVRMPESQRAISYEMHGNSSGSRRVCFVMGFRGSLDAWTDIVGGLERTDTDYALLVLDNRGSGLSTNGRYEMLGYSTAGMALDVHRGSHR